MSIHTMKFNTKEKDNCDALALKRYSSPNNKKTHHHCKQKQQKSRDFSLYVIFMNIFS